MRGWTYQGIAHTWRFWAIGGYVSHRNRNWTGMVIAIGPVRILFRRLLTSTERDAFDGV